jgi:hypothetical protein
MLQPAMERTFNVGQSSGLKGSVSSTGQSFRYINGQHHQRNGFIRELPRYPFRSQTYPSRQSTFSSRAIRIVFLWCLATVLCCYSVSYTVFVSKMWSVEKVDRLQQTSVLSYKVAALKQYKNNSRLSECRLDTLGHPPLVAERCIVNDAASVNASSSSPPCAQLTYFNILTKLSAAGNHAKIARELFKSHPVRIPSDGELAANDGSGSCDFWRMQYGFDDLPPVSADEADFPIAFNILTHENAHQVDNIHL